MSGGDPSPAPGVPVGDRSRKKIRGPSLGRSGWGTRCPASRAPGRAQQPCATLRRIVGPRGGSYRFPSGRTVTKKISGWLRPTRARHLSSPCMAHAMRRREEDHPKGCIPVRGAERHKNVIRLHRPPRWPNCSVPRQPQSTHLTPPLPSDGIFTRQGVVPHPLFVARGKGVGVREVS